VAAPSRPRRAWLARVSSFAVSAGVLAALYAAVGERALLDVLLAADPRWVGAAVVAIAPLTVFTAWRFAMVVPGAVGLGEATRLVLAASALNVVLPSKLGDLAKALFLRERSDLAGPVTLAAVFFEKASDLFGLLSWCLLGLLLLPGDEGLVSFARVTVTLLVVALALVLGSRRVAAVMFGLPSRALPDRAAAPVRRLGAAWSELLGALWGPGGRGRRIVAASLVLWLMHLVQIWMFARALEPAMPLGPTVALVPVAIVAGLLPFTVAGVGTRDAALVAVLAGHLAPTSAAALGVLTTLRYVVPAVLGLPYLGRYAAQVRALACREREEAR
jgi:uncharacterized membrane protein YbhN (UPF0104 family)